MPGPAPTAMRVRFGPFELDAAAGELRKSGVPVKLQPQPFRILQLLIESAGKVVTREEIQHSVWNGDTFVDFEHGINFSINQIRTALADSAEKPRYIETLPRRGYRFIGAVEFCSDLSAREGAPSPDTVSVSRRFTSTAWILGIFLVVGLATYFTWLRFHRIPQSARVMLAVLPFQNLTGNPDQEYISDGLTEEMITRLGSLNPERLGVISRTSVMGYKNGIPKLDQIGRELGVQYVLEGSLRETPGHLRITAQLIRVQDQSHVWAQNYDQGIKDVLAVEDEVAIAVAEQTQSVLTPAARSALSHPRTVNPEAHEAYLMGRFLWYKRTRADELNSLTYFQKAIALDPKDPLNFSGMADAYIALGGQEWVPANEAFPQAKEAALKALALDDTLAEAHSALGQAYQADRDWAGTEKECKRALALNPSYAVAHQRCSYFLSKVGRYEEAVMEAKSARELDPLSSFASAIFGQSLYMARRFNEAQQVLQRTVELDPGAYAAFVNLAGTYSQKGKFSESIALLEKLARGSPDDMMVQGPLGYAYAKSGRKADAETLLKNLTDESRTKYVSGYFLSWICIGLGRKEDAMEWLERAYQRGEYQLTWMRAEPVFDPLRSDPRFADLVRKVGLPQ